MDFFAFLARILALRGIQFVGLQTLKNPGSLLPAEKRLVAGARPLRQKQFATGRWCAREALERMGRAPRAIGCGPAGEPLWPAGVCGSISHTAGACAAAVAATSRYAALGLDVESRPKPMSREALALIANPDERRWLARAPSKRQEYGKIMFGAKECAFKLLYPLVRKPFGFDALSLAQPPADGKTRLRVRRRLGGAWRPGQALDAQYFANDQWIVTVAWWPEDAKGKR